MSTYNTEIFLGDLNVKLNEAELNYSMSVDITMKNFIFDKYASLIKATRKEK